MRRECWLFTAAPEGKLILPSIHPDPEMVIAVDGGALHARAHGVRYQTLVGDFDSIDAPTLEEDIAAGCDVHRFPVEKDFSDLEGALPILARKSPTHVKVFGALGGRSAHYVGALFSLSAWLHEQRGDIQELCLVGEIECHYLLSRGSLDLLLPRGTTLSLLSLTPATRGVSASGLHWTLDDATVLQSSTRTLSNRVAHEQVRITVQEGILLVVVEQGYSALR